MAWPKGKPRKKKRIEKLEDIAPNVLIPYGQPNTRGSLASIRNFEMLLRRKLMLAEKIATEYQTRVQVYAELLETLDRMKSEKSG